MKITRVKERRKRKGDGGGRGGGDGGRKGGREEGRRGGGKEGMEEGGKLGGTGKGGIVLHLIRGWRKECNPNV